MNSKAFLLTSILVLALQACGGGGGGGGATDTGSGGGVRESWSGVLTPDGGTLSSPSGVEIQADPGAVRAEVAFAISKTALPAPLPAGALQVGEAFELSPADDGAIEKELKVSLPYGDSENEDQMQVLHWNSAAEKWEVAPLFSQDTVANRIRFTTRTFSPFVPVGYPRTLERFDTGFLPESHGWRFANFSSYWSEGHCLGMVAYAGWFFQAHRDEHLYFDAHHQAEAAGKQVAIRAQCSDGDAWNSFERGLPAQIERAHELKRNMKSTGLPHALIIYNLEASKIGHAVLACGFDEERFVVYDPDFPGERRFLFYNDKEGATYTIRTRYQFHLYTGFTYVPPSTGHGIAFEDLYRGAHDYFRSSPFPKIRITSHQHAETAKDRGVILQGTVEANGGPAPSAMVAFVNGIAFHPTLYGSGGQFDLSIPISHGDNLIEVYAGSGPLTGQPTWQPHLGVTHLRLVGSQPTSPLFVVVSLDQDASLHSIGRVDLYLYDPGGKCVTYDGIWYPPSYWQEPAPKKGLYRIRIHNNTFPQPTLVRGTITVVIDGKGYSRSFTVADSLNDNWRPWNTGSDWLEIGWVDPSSGPVWSR